MVNFILNWVDSRQKNSLSRSYALLGVSEIKYVIVLIYVFLVTMDIFIGKNNLMYLMNIFLMKHTHVLVFILTYFKDLILKRE